MYKRQLLPLVTKLVEFIGNAAEKFSGLSDKQQGDLLGLGGILAASGPALKVIDVYKRQALYQTDLGRP